MSNKLKQPMNPLIFKTAANLCAVWFETALSSGMPRGKYVGTGDKPLKMFVQDHLEKFLPLTISILIDMLKPTSNCTEHMRQEIHAALTDPLTDPDLMALAKNKSKTEHQNMIANAIRNFDKNKIVLNQPVIANQPVTKLDFKNSTVLGGRHG